ncbi:MAG: chemotaxis-specific protein-glutamate methyltransferase CheB [Holosporales bacterium]|jgi:two-component system chemotaxis response regulator CheB
MEQSNATASNRIGVLVVDDSSVVRGMFQKILHDESDMAIIATAANGQIALDILQQKLAAIDAVILDIEMPVMDGLTALPRLLAIKPSLVVIISSGLSERAAELSIKSLALGAKDYVAKPKAKGDIGTSKDFRVLLLSKIRALCSKIETFSPKLSTKPATNTPTLHRDHGAPIRALAIGCSTGGPQALINLLGTLPKIPHLPIFITQHMPATFTKILGQQITNTTLWPCHEAVHNQIVEPGCVYLAPGDYHMQATAEGAIVRIVLNQNPPENFCRPAVDPMLRSLADIYGKNLLTLILTGMGSDGMKGCREVMHKGGIIWAQDEASSVVWGMPGSAYNAGVCNKILPLNEIATTLIKRINGGGDA